MIGPNGSPHERHLRFVGRLAPFYIVAAQTGAHQVLPGVLAAAALWHNVIDREGHTRESAILALVPIAPKDIFSGEDYLLEGYAHVSPKTNDTGERHRDRSRVY